MGCSGQVQPWRSQLPREDGEVKTCGANCSAPVGELCWLDMFRRFLPALLACMALGACSHANSNAPTPATASGTGAAPVPTQAVSTQAAPAQAGALSAANVEPVAKVSGDEAIQYTR